MKKIFLFLIVILINSNFLFAKTIVKKDSTKVNDSLKVEKLADREIKFDLDKLSFLASMSVYGKTQYRGDGLVVVLATINEDGIVTKVEIKETNNKKLNLPALEAIKKYVKKYKVQPAVKNGVKVTTEDMVIPIKFDMSLFD